MKLHYCNFSITTHTHKAAALGHVSFALLKEVGDGNGEASFQIAGTWLCIEVATAAAPASAPATAEQEQWKRPLTKSTTRQLNRRGGTRGPVGARESWSWWRSAVKWNCITHFTRGCDMDLKLTMLESKLCCKMFITVIMGISKQRCTKKTILKTLFKFL